MHASRTFTLPASLPLVRARVSLRLIDDAILPSYKGALLRGGFGYAFQRASCPQSCWGQSAQCPNSSPCPYRWIFETRHPPTVQHLHDLRDVPRPFVIEPPLDRRKDYQAGDLLEFGLVLVGRGIDYLPYFLYSFEYLGKQGLGRQFARARLERVEALHPWQPVGVVLYQDGRVLADQHSLPFIDEDAINARAAALPHDLRVVLHTPLRVKHGGEWLRQIEPTVIVQAICWRLNALATFHGGGPLEIDHRALVEQAHAITVEAEDVHWVDWERTSTRGEEPRPMKLGGIIGSAVLRDVPPAIRAVLLAGSVVHIGKACTFGHGKIEVQLT